MNGLRFGESGLGEGGEKRALYWIELTQFIGHRLAGENLKGSTVTARACLMGANLIDAGGL